MRTKTIICFVFLLSVFIIVKENKLISKVSDKLSPNPQPPPEADGHWIRFRQNGFNMTLSNPAEPLYEYSSQRLVNTTKSDKEYLPPPSKANGRKHVLLLATTRTGSSFVGEIFNQHGANMFYLFEPLWHVEHGLFKEDGRTNMTLLASSYLEVLRQLFLCDFSLLESFIKPPPQDHVTTSLFRRGSSQPLCEDPVCTPYDKKVFERFQCRNRRCGPLNFTLASQSCLQRQHRAIKSVRVRQLETLRPLVEDPRLDIKFIQLVRDPRAVLASRLVAFPFKYKNWKDGATDSEIPDDQEEEKKLIVNCDNIRMSAETGLKRPAWLHGRYMLVRYEDFALFPMQKAAEMYQFTGIPFTSEVKNWILKNTHASSKVNVIYSTKKNSSQQMDMWRVTFPFKLAQVVQKVCGSAMTMFGYKFVESEEMLRNLSISLIEERTFL
ncbi:carbohydrate sulfotransferase 3-like [Hoplias malabaricus]|uniref:carbohydrate sulfotransferase 3-like n=1 Tax=Hoplias malabaricus TaxID=27720 RepID=UPI003463153C